IMLTRTQKTTYFPYTTLFRSKIKKKILMKMKIKIQMIIPPKITAAKIMVMLKQIIVKVIKKKKTIIKMKIMKRLMEQSKTVPHEIESKNNNSNKNNNETTDH